jgi:uncharacterized small protein (DUF1192 family)
MKVQDRIAKLDDEIVDAEDLLAYWLCTEDPTQVEEAPGRIAVLETDLENLRAEREVLTQHGAIGDK